MLTTKKTDPISRTPLRLALAGAAVVTLTGLASCANNDMSGMDHGSGSSASAAPSASRPSAASTPAEGSHNDADVMFASMMIPHHQQAIEMSDMVLAKDGIDAAVIDLAQQIKDAQAPEIAQMKGWLVGWGANPSPSGMSDMDNGGDGTMSQADMDALDQATGSDAARLFLTGMVKHHQGAITMAQEEVANGENPEAKKLAGSIITSQQAEIEKMNTLLESL
jgi:uncharacterized protein (DUF305 family)